MLMNGRKRGDINGIGNLFECWCNAIACNVLLYKFQNLSLPFIKYWCHVSRFISKITLLTKPEDVKSKIKEKNKPPEVILIPMGVCLNCILVFYRFFSESCHILLCLGCCFQCRFPDYNQEFDRVGQDIACVLDDADTLDHGSCELQANSRTALHVC